MSRLRSLQSPSPQPSPRPSASPKHAAANANPFPQDVTTYHRKLRALIGEVKATMGAWDEEVREGFIAAKGMVDEGTEIDNILSLPSSSALPSIIPHVTLYRTHTSNLVTAFARLEKLLNKFRLLKDAAEALILEAGRLKGWEFVLGLGSSSVDLKDGERDDGVDGPGVESFWQGGTWSMERFVDSIQPLPLVHATHLSVLNSFSVLISSPLQDSPDDLEQPTSKPGPSSRPPHGRPPPPNHTDTRSGANPAEDNDEDEDGFLLPSATLPYDRQAIFELQKTLLETWADQLGPRSERGRWRLEWTALVEGEMSGWAEEEG